MSYAIIIKNWKSKDVDESNVQLTFGIVTLFARLGWHNYDGGISISFFWYGRFNYEVDIINKKKRPDLLKDKWGCEVFEYNL